LLVIFLALNGHFLTPQALVNGLLITTKNIDIWRTNCSRWNVLEVFNINLMTWIGHAFSRYSLQE